MPLNPTPHPAALESQFQPVPSLLLSTGVNCAHRNPLSHGIHPCSRWHLPHSHRERHEGVPRVSPAAPRQARGVAAMTSPSLGCCRAGHRPEETKAIQTTVGTGSEWCHPTPCMHTHTDVIPSQGAGVSREVQVPEGESSGFVICEGLAQCAHPCSKRVGEMDGCRLPVLGRAMEQSKGTSLQLGSRTSLP